jgi:methylated-DNA-[protein]-cysteine S-methyltransferase
LILGSARRGNVWYATVTSIEEELVACSFSDNKKAAEQSAIHSLPNDLRRDLVRSPGKSKIIGMLHRIYTGKGINRRPSIALMPPSQFLRRVYKATMKIPRGKVITYGDLAKLVNSRRAARAVGNAMARNPLPLVIPCHRVVLSTLQVGNYGSERNGRSRTKRALLVNEGVQFEGEKISQKCVWDPY